jgi:hypothetical protein
VAQFGATLRNTSVDVTITVADTAKIRVLPKNEFDDKGRIKRFRPDPKDPDRRLGGVKGEFKDIEKGTWVAVNLRRNRSGSLHLAHVVVVLGSEDGKPGRSPGRSGP